MALDCHVRKGEHGARVIFWSPVKRTRQNAEGEEQITTFPLLREYTVFNAQQCDGAERFQVQPSDNIAPVVDFEPAEKVIQATR
jgi:antirestriction protein ArdC